MLGKNMLQKISKILKLSVVQSFFNHIVGINSRPAHLLKKASIKVVFLKICQNFQHRILSSNMISVFDKIVGHVLQGRNFIKRWSTLQLSLIIFFLRQLIFKIYSKRNLRRSLFIAELQSVHCRFVTCKMSKLSQSVIFRNIFICAEDSNHKKDYLKVMC